MKSENPNHSSELTRVPSEAPTITSAEGRATGLSDLIFRFQNTVEALRDLIQVLPPILGERAEKAVDDDHIRRIGYAHSICEGIADQKYPDEIQKALDSIKTENPPVEKQAEMLRAFKLPIRVGKDGRLRPDRASVNLHHVIEVIQRAIRSSAQISLIHESSLMTLVSSAELLLARLVHSFYDRYPATAGETEKFFSLTDLYKFENVEAARSVLIDSRVEQLMRGSFEDWLTFLRDKTHITLEYLEEDREVVSEVFKRRNLFVHNGGIVNGTYIGAVSTRFTSGLKPGDRLRLDLDYLISAVDLLGLHFVLIAAELWRKWDKSAEERPGTLAAITYEHMKAERWVLAEKLSQFAMNDAKTSESSRLMGQINYWLSLKMQGRYQEIRAAVADSDFSAKAMRFQLARHAITEDYDRFFSMLPDALQRGEVTVHDLREWPLLKGVREQARFKPFVGEDEGQG